MVARGRHMRRDGSRGVLPARGGHHGAIVTRGPFSPPALVLAKSVTGGHLQTFLRPRCRGDYCVTATVWAESHTIRSQHMTAGALSLPSFDCSTVTNPPSPFSFLPPHPRTTELTTSRLRYSCEYHSARYWEYGSYVSASPLLSPPLPLPFHSQSLLRGCAVPTPGGIP